MQKLQAVLMRYNKRGVVAVVEDSAEMDSVTVATMRTPSPRKACEQAADRLERLARQFRALADEDEPYKEVTHNRIARTVR